MRKRIYSAIVIVLSLASVSVATYVGLQKAAAQKAKTTAQKSSAGQAGAKGKATTANRSVQVVPTRPPDPNLAPQAAVDDALYTSEEFFGAQAVVARPYAVALERVSALAGQYPKDARLHLHAARLSEHLGQFDKAAAEITQYADLKRRSPNALRRLANFYNNRARFSDEVRTLVELAKSLPVNERAVIYKRAALVVRSHALKDFKPADFFAELVAADPSNVQPVKNYVEELKLAEQYKEALAVLTTIQPKFPSELEYFLKTRADILEEMDDRRAAEAVYDSAFDPNWPRAISGNYYELLRQFGRYRTVRRSLQDKVRAGTTDLPTVARLFSILSYEGNYEQASRLLTDLEDRRAGRAPRRAATTTPPSQPTAVSVSWNARELETVAAMFTSIGDFDQASRYLYTLYLVGGLQPGSAAREDALYRLFKVMLDAAGTPTRVAAGNLSLYRDVAQADPHPGFMNGVLSLILSGTNPAQEFATQEKSAASYFNRAFAYRIFSAFKQEYAQSKYLAEMYLGVTEVFSTLGEHRLTVEAGREFQQLYPDSPRYVDVSLRIADAYVSLKDRVHERAVLAELLDRLARTRPKGTPLVVASSKRWTTDTSPGIDKLIDTIRYRIEAYSDTYDPTEDKSSTNNDNEDNESDSEEGSSSSSDEGRAKHGPTYSSVLERYVASLAQDDKKTETVALFWGEIKKHPREEGLYERFLRWLGQAELVNEQLKAYNSAIRQFDSNTWYHRLARWYVRQKRGKELRNYTRQLINIFDEDDITEYLLRFAGYGSEPTSDGLIWNQQLAFELYNVAHTRFPRNLFFVRGMLTYLANVNVGQWEQLSAQYYFADRSIREPYLAWLSNKNQLRDRYQKARGQNAGSASQPLNTYRIFAADAAMWLSHHDEAIDAYRQLVALYPGEPQYADRLADLTRSLGQQSDKLYEESARTLQQMAVIYPSDHSYRIKAGEVYAELGDFKRAGEQWDKLTALEPGERNTYLEVATVYWDYYQFDDSIRVFKELRNVTGDQTIYAYRMGAVYEGKGDMDSAIAEYVKVLSEPGDGRDTVSKRLAQLSRRKGLAEKIAAAYERAHTATPDDWQLVIGYANYQAEREHQADALALLRTEVSRSNDVEFLETVRDLFRAILRPEDEQQVIARLTQSARDEREAMMYRLQLAAFLERHNQVDQAIGIIDKLVADYPTNIGVVEESAQFYWRAGLLDRSLDLYKRTIARAQGTNRRTLILAYARRQSEAGKLADAETTLRAFYNEDRSDTEVFSELARTLGAENKMQDLATLYREAFKDVRESGLSSDDAKARIIELRGGMIRTLTSLNKFEEAVDQHIEIINLFPEDEDKLTTAMDYAAQHNLTARLTAYYEKLTKDAFKNYRWQLVLGRMYERLGDLAAATNQYRGVVANEPQRAEFRYSLANLLARQRRFDEAITVLRDGWVLAGRDPAWLTEVARIQIRQGKRDDAIQTMRQALAAKKNVKIADQITVAGQLATWGLNAEAVRLYEQAFAGLPKVLKEEYVDGSEFARYIRTLVRTEPVANAFQKIERMRAQFEAIGENSQDTDKYRAQGIVTAIDGAMRSDFGRGVIDHATSAEASALAQAMNTATAKLTTYGDAGSLRRYLGIARGAGLVEVEEQFQTRLKDVAFAARPKNLGQPNVQDTSYYSELRALVAFYNRHAVYLRAAEILDSEFKRDPYKNRFDYQNQIAIEHRFAGDSQNEMESLRVAYATASGTLVTSKTEWVGRYLDMLYASNARDQLEQLASKDSPYQLQLIDFFMEKNEKALARKAIRSASLTEAWKSSRSAEVGLFLKDTSAETETDFKNVLAIAPIGAMLKRVPEQAKTLVGDDWYVAARNYGYWLGLTPARNADSRRYVMGEIEGHPANARAQLEVAAYYLDRKDPTRAANHNAIAAELAPGSREVTVMRGSIALQRGDRKGALDAWATLMSGRVSVTDAETYLRVMGDNGFFREALPTLGNFIVGIVNQATRSRSGGEGREAIKPLVRDIAARAQSDAKLTAEVATFFHTTITSTPDDFVIGSMLIEENLLPETTLASVYRTMHQRYADAAAAAFGTSEAENGYYNGSEYFYPARALADWRKRFVDYLIRTRSFDEARLLIATIKQELADNSVALQKPSDDEESGDATMGGRYDWVPLASALVELRSGRDVPKAIAELRDYCGLNSDAKGDSYAQQEDGSHIHVHCVKAYTLLVAEGRASEADDLLYDAYRMALRSRYTDEGSLAGLAELEVKRGHGDEATRLLKVLVERATDNLSALRLAAETAARINRLADAIDFREQIALANPDDSQNRLELARVMAASGRAGDALDRLATFIGERTTPNTVRAQAAEVAGDIVRADRSQAAHAASLFEQRATQGDAAANLARAAVAEATGNADDARTALGRISNGPLAAVAQMKLGVIALGANQQSVAVTNFERALYLDADGVITDAIAFRAAGPRAQLIPIYSRTARELAAVQLAEGESEESGQRSLISTAVRNALRSGSNNSERTAAPTLAVSFEPSLAVTRAKGGGLRTIAELNLAAASKISADLLAPLVEAATRLRQYDRAIALQRLLAMEATKPDEKSALEKRLAEMIAQESARQARLNAVLRIDKSNTTPSIYAARVIGQ